ncbi:TPA: tyrosine-type recombinase/integrase [Vibrio parahaemolyticus]|uniref:tyrosine-type recombinase/integrase n=3 Tax=Vibrio parahaemolyticus TaxID=670 RepID=UPI000932D0E0|nr:tyrosine-type recombinase/integrase [Vibrio parahaemolyticus]EGQ8195804.1 tyrosine-type recombinase/integrase [Vibrio parahaemolyticus]TPA40126.1 integrase [Vibrio parahaemolyticus]TPA53887.1 integrase [Vibrio parahaemolyticus]HCE2536553.1 tyrosine-type recombinase/integrase [Vibrio parahaemolyticus]HCE4725302.1 tyrosine-type recombinase/integrase [Vibrio parahaemolyticus]
MATVQPIANKQHLLLAEQHIKANHDEAYWLLWRIGCETGFRVTDITEIRYSEVNWQTGVISIAENKGTKARKARARLKVLEKVKNELIARNSTDPSEMMRIFITSPKDIYALIPSDMLADVDKRIAAAQDAAPEKRRTAKVSNRTLTALKARYERYGVISNDQIFARATLRTSNRARNVNGVLSRQAVWAVLSKLTDLLNGLGESVRVGCHSMRKTFARHLYEATGRDIALLMRTIGHSSPAMSLRYIGITGDEELSAQDKLFAYME